MADAMTWAMLLARWTEFARSAVALPTDGAGGRWRESVPAIIGLQAIALALGDLDGQELDEDRALAIDTASVGIDRHARALAATWGNEPWPEELHELLEDARGALVDARASGLEWCVDGGSASLQHPAEVAGYLEAIGFDGDLYLAMPGQELSKSCPCAFLHAPDGRLPDRAAIDVVGGYLEAHGIGGNPARRGPPRQAFRQFDFALGGPVRDLVVWMAGEPRAGQPLLVPVVLDGQMQAVPLPLRRGKPASPPPLEFEADVSEGAGAGD